MYSVQLDEPEFQIGYCPSILNEMDAQASEDWARFLRVVNGNLKREYRSLILKSRRRNELRAMFKDGKTWTTKKGETLSIQSMTPDHARKTLAMLRNKWPIYRDILYYTDGWFEETPLIVALSKRAADRETLVDKVQDWYTYRQYKKGTNHRV